MLLVKVDKITVLCKSVRSPTGFSKVVFKHGAMIIYNYFQSVYTIQHENTGKLYAVLKKTEKLRFFRSDSPKEFKM